jgi:superfamily II DNA/RNA helicase
MSTIETTFESFGLAAPLLGNIARLGFTTPTSVQVEAIPHAMQGGDWMVSSRTGSGKTAAFLLPILNAILAANEGAPAPAKAPGQNPWTGGEKVNSRKQRSGGRDQRFEPVAPQAIVLCPTRELAQQVAADAINFVHGLRGVRVAIVVGGVPFVKQVAELQNASLVVATPGRLLDLQEQRKIRLDNVKFLVVDEADRMLDLGFQEDLERISNSCANRDQTLMFSATFAPRIMQLASAMMNNPGRLELATAQDKHADITQTLHWADGLQHKKNLLGHWLRTEGSDQILVFASTQIDTEAIADELVEEGYNAAALHGAMPQHVRNRRLQNLRDGRIKILVATDVAARGIDVPSISHVINFGLPMKAEDYVHRIGRTGRAGRSGVAVTLAEFRERHKIRAIEQYTQQIIKADVIEGLEPTPRKSFDGGGRRDGGRPARGGGGGGGYGYQGGYGRQGGNDRQEGFRTAEVREFKPAPRGDWKPAGNFADRPAGGGYAGKSAGFAGKPSGGFKGQEAGGYRGGSEGGQRAAPEGGYRGAPEGGFRAAPEGGFAGKPARTFADRPAGGYAGKSNGFAGKPAGGQRGAPEGGYRGAPEGGFAARSEGGFAGKPSGGYAGKPSGFAGRVASGFGAKSGAGFGAKPAGGGYAGKPAGGFGGKNFTGADGKPTTLSKPLYAKPRRAA